MQKITKEAVEKLRNQNPPLSFSKIAKLFGVTKMTAYNHSKQGAKKLKEYQKSDKFKATQKKYQQSEKGKKTLKKWLQSDAGKASRRKVTGTDAFKLKAKHAHHVKNNKVFNNCELCKKQTKQ